MYIQAAGQQSTEWQGGVQRGSRHCLDIIKGPSFFDSLGPLFSSLYCPLCPSPVTQSTATHRRPGRGRDRDRETERERGRVALCNAWLLIKISGREVGEMVVPHRGLLSIDWCCFLGPPGEILKFWISDLHAALFSAVCAFSNWPIVQGIGHCRWDYFLGGMDDCATKSGRLYVASTFRSLEFKSLLDLYE